MRPNAVRLIYSPTVTTSDIKEPIIPKRAVNATIALLEKTTPQKSNSYLFVRGK